MPWADQEESRRNIAANHGLYRLISGEEPQLVGELRAMFTWIPDMAFTVEVYAPMKGTEDQFPSFQTWLLGAHQVLISATDGDAYVKWYQGREESRDFGSLGTLGSHEVIAIISRAILRHRAGGHSVH